MSHQLQYRHDRPDGSGPCDYLGYEVHMAICNKCGWSSPELKLATEELEKRISKKLTLMAFVGFAIGWVAGALAMVLAP